MVNIIQTLKNLNKEFPRYKLETLIKNVECIVEKPDTNTWWDKNITTYPPTITCTYNNGKSCTTLPDDAKFTSSTPENVGFVYTTCTKNHAVDKTSAKQNILTEEDPNFLKDIKEML